MASAPCSICAKPGQASTKMPGVALCPRHLRAWLRVVEEGRERARDFADFMGAQHRPNCLDTVTLKEWFGRWSAPLIKASETKRLGPTPSGVAAMIGKLHSRTKKLQIAPNSTLEQHREWRELQDWLRGSCKARTNTREQAQALWVEANKWASRLIELSSQQQTGTDWRPNQAVAEDVYAF